MQFAGFHGLADELRVAQFQFLDVGRRQRLIIGHRRFFRVPLRRAAFQLTHPSIDRRLLDFCWNLKKQQQQQQLSDMPLF